jgi:hypothetical protein
MNEQDHPDNRNAFGAEETVHLSPVPEPAPVGGGPRGTMRFQDAANTRPRPPTLAEQRARLHAEEEAAELAEQRTAAAGRRRLMIGGGVTVGIVGLIAAGYLLASPQTVTARCTVSDSSGTATVVSDNLCDPQYAAGHGGYLSNGFVFIPLIGGGFRQYHYYYGGSGVLGHQASGGSFTPPSNATIRTGSGQTIQRGGFGIGGHSGGTAGTGGTGGTGGRGGNTGGVGGTGGGELSGGHSGGS